MSNAHHGAAAGAGSQLRPLEDAFVGQTMVTSQDDAPSSLVEITATQKMLSAISGSLLTSLLSASPLARLDPEKTVLLTADFQ